MSQTTTKEQPPALTSPLTKHITQETTAPWRDGVRRTRWTWPKELTLIAALFGLYEQLRLLAPSSPWLANHHAELVMRVERALRLPPEAWWNDTLHRLEGAPSLAGHYYALAHFTVTPLLLVWLWKRHRHEYALWRSTLVAMSFVAVGIYVAFPVAPPRLVLPGVTDTLVSEHVLGLSTAHGISGLVNQYAAMPSLHVGWAAWCAMACSSASRRRWVQVLVWAHPVVTTVVVFATANHYYLDALVAVALALAAFAGVQRVRGRPRHRVASEPLA